VSKTEPAETPTRTYRIVVAEDAYLVREGIRQVLEQEDEVEVELL
jgi:hypothetical protein